jgi:hypothetical protein
VFRIFIYLCRPFKNLPRSQIISSNCLIVTFLFLLFLIWRLKASMCSQINVFSFFLSFDAIPNRHNPKQSAPISSFVFILPRSEGGRSGENETRFFCSIRGIFLFELLLCLNLISMVVAHNEQTLLETLRG